MNGRRVVITGIGAVSPLGVGARALFDRWAAGESGIEDGLGRCDEFVPTELLSQKEVKRSDRFTQLSLAAAQEALGQAGWEDDLPVEPERIGCIVGTGFGGIGTMEEQHTALRDRGAKRVSQLTVPMMMPNAGAGAIALRYGLRGQAYCIASACAAGTDAIGAAAQAIAVGHADAMVAGGGDASVTPLGIAAAAKMGATSRVGVSRPFDARRDGFILAEGSGILALEAAELAEERGAEVLAEVIGYGATVDGYHLTAPAPDGSGAAKAIDMALRSAGIGPEDVDYVNAHGTSTPLNDRIETLAIKQVFGEHAKRVPVSSTKSVIGHLLGAAGAAEAVATVQVLRERMAPPTVNYEEPEEGLDLDYVPEGPRKLDVNGGPAVAISNSFGFGGHNGVLCLAA